MASVQLARLVHILSFLCQSRQSPIRLPLPFFLTLQLVTSNLGSKQILKSKMSHVDNTVDEATINAIRQRLLETGDWER